MRVLALDVGTKRIGMAVSDPFGITARPHATIPRNRQAYQIIKETVAKMEVNRIVVGLPKHLNGSESDQAKDVRAFAERLSKSIPGIEIVFWDERLTSIEAEQRLSAKVRDWRKRKKQLDAYAASILLESYLQER